MDSSMPVATESCPPAQNVAGNPAGSVTSPIDGFPLQTPTEGFDFGQFVSRSFNFLYVFVSSLVIICAPFSVNDWSWEKRALWLVAAMLGDLLLVQGFKHLCYIPRPCASQRFCWGRRAHSGFPSGHTLPAFLLASLIIGAHPHLWFWFVGAVLIGWARWQVKAHYAYQVAVSALLGTGLGLFMGRFL